MPDMPFTSSESRSKLWTITKWTIGIGLFPITVPFLLIRYFLRQKPNLSQGKKLFGSIAIAFGWVLFLLAIPSSNTDHRSTIQNIPVVSKELTTVITTSTEVSSEQDKATTTEKTTIPNKTNQLALAVVTGTEIQASPQATSGIQAATNLVEDQSKLFSVVRVIDGDTIDVSIDGKTERVRLIGIDTPETVDPRKPVQCFGKEASTKLHALLTGKMVNLEDDPSQDARDKYGRMLAYVFLADGTHINLLMIQRGYANEYTYRVPYKYQSTFKAAALAAKQAKVGLWADEACAGDTTQPTPIKSEGTKTDTSQSQSSGSVIKKSTNGICHEPGSTYYYKTKDYTPYANIESCLQSGGRLPLR